MYTVIWSILKPYLFIFFTKSFFLDHFTFPLAKFPTVWQILFACFTHVDVFIQSISEHGADDTFMIL